MMHEGGPMAADHSGRASLDLSGTSPRALGAIRRWVSTQLAALGHSHVKDVIQVADELASNAYEHAGGPCAIHLTYHPTPCSVTVEVQDDRTAAPTLGRSRFGPSAHRGRGVMLVDQLSRAWGVLRPAPGHSTKTVWAEIACPHNRAPPDNQKPQISGPEHDTGWCLRTL